MAGAFPRLVVVRRRTDYELLLARHATRGQAEFYLRQRGQSMGSVEAEHGVVRDVVSEVQSSAPDRWRRTAILRDDLNRFLFEPSDVIVAVGQDGLVANVAKYLNDQPVIGVNPLPGRFDGVLARVDREAVPGLLKWIDGAGSPPVEERTMVRASLDDGQSILALNEVFIGHRSHQSARYRVCWEASEERQSSSGMIVTTGTGSTGWARSINQSRESPLTLPLPTEKRLAFFVREAFPSVSTGTKLTSGAVGPNQNLTVVSEMNEQGVVFGDGIESDSLAFDFGQRLVVGVADRCLHLVTT